MNNFEYNLSIYCVDGSIYSLISRDKKQLHEFLKEYDHEGSSLNLVRKENTVFTEIDCDNIYKELEVEEVKA